MKEKKQIYIYVDTDDVVAPLTIRMPRCFTGKVKGSWRTEVKYFNDVDDVVNNNKVILEFDAKDLYLLDDVFVIVNNGNNDSVGKNVNDGYHMKRYLSQEEKVAATCTYIGCELRIYASLVPRSTTFMVKTMKNKHNCTRLSIIKAIKSTWIIKMILPVNSVDPNISNEELNTILKEKYGIKPHLIWL